MQRAQHVYRLNHKTAIELIPDEASSSQRNNNCISEEDGTSSLLSLRLSNFSGSLVERLVENGGERESASVGNTNSRILKTRDTCPDTTQPAVLNGVLSKDPAASYVKKTIPSDLRAARAKQNGNISEAPTGLHELCAMPDVTLNDLNTQLTKDPKATAISDSKGRLPLHVLGCNDALLLTPDGKETASAFVWEIIHVNPHAITALDNDGFMPFVSLIKDWYVWNYEHQSDAPTERDLSTDDRERQLLTRSTTSFPQAGMWEEVEWAFDMLSLEMNELGEKNGGLFKQKRPYRVHPNEEANRARLALATHVAEKMPTIIKMILLLEDEAGTTRKRLLSSPIVRRMFLRPETVKTPWLTSMLHRQGLASKRAIDYLVLVSLTTVTDYVGEYRAVLREDEHAYDDELGSVFSTLESMDGLVASLVVLPDRDTERAALTPVMWHIMSNSLARPLTVSLVLIDFVLLLALLVSYRNELRNGLLLDDPATNFVGALPYQVVYVICSHFFIRKAGETIALLAISAKVFRSYALNLWTIFDVLAVCLALVATSLNQTQPENYRAGLDAVVLGFLWLRLIGFMKVINKQMALFVLSLNDILRDLIYFALVLLLVIFMFADMMTIVVAYQDDGQFCSTESGSEDVVRDFCTGDPIDAYLRVYALLIGDFSLDEYRENSGMTVLFVIFTVIGVIILLNVIIAIISESYERAQDRSERLFGRARVLFVAQNQALESFLRPFTGLFEDLDVFGKPPRFVIFLGPIFRWCILLTLLGTAIFTEIFLWWQALENLTNDGSVVVGVLFLVLATIMIAALWVFISFTLDCVLRVWHRERGNGEESGKEGCITRFIVRKTAGLFGTIGIDKTSLLEEEEE